MYQTNQKGSDEICRQQKVPYPHHNLKGNWILSRISKVPGYNQGIKYQILTWFEMSQNVKYC